MRTPRVAVIILNWNGYQDTITCLDSLSRLEYPYFTTIVVDNGSTDGSDKQIRDSSPGTILLESGENLGFSAGNNLGIQKAEELDVDLVLLLNNDTVVDPAFLGLLVSAAQREVQTGVVGPTIYYFSQPETIWSAGGKIDWSSGTTEMMEIGNSDAGQCGIAPREVDFVTGCALLVKMSVIHRAGMLDPRFFMYYEEAEWCNRIKRLGYKVLHVPQAKIWHKISPEKREASAQVHYYMTRNRLLFLNATKAGVKPWLRTLIFDYARTLLSWTLKPKWRIKRPQRDAMVRAISDYTMQHFGRVDLT